jgi:hypothetical protein
MQSPEVDTSVINNQVTFSKPNALISSKLHKVVGESILWQARYFIALGRRLRRGMCDLRRLLWRSTIDLREHVIGR